MFGIIPLFIIALKTIAIGNKCCKGIRLLAGAELVISQQYKYQKIQIFIVRQCAVIILRLITHSSQQRVYHNLFAVDIHPACQERHQLITQTWPY